MATLFGDSSNRRKPFMKKREQKVEEHTKNAMFIRGSQRSQTVKDILHDLYMLKKPHALPLNKKNETRPFEDPSTIEFLANKNDCSLFVFGSHTKKRPNNIILGRFFDYHILDMIELGVQNYKSSSQFESIVKASFGNKPGLIFIGEEWEQKEEYKKLGNILLDFFRGQITDGINLAGLEHVIVCTSTAEKIYFRVYRVFLKKSGTKLPRVELAEMGPSMEWIIRRTAFANEELLKQATKVPRELKPKKVKNVSTNIFDTKGKIHIPRQDLSEMSTKKMKGLKKRSLEDNDSNGIQKKSKS